MEAIDKKESLELYSMLIGYRKEAESFMPPALKLTPLKPPDSEEKVISNKPRLKDYTAKANSFLPTKAAEDAFYAGYIDEMDKTSGMLSTGIKTISGIGSKIMGSKIGLGATELMKSPAVQKMKPIATKAITGATVLGSANTALSHGNTFKPMSMPSMPKMPSMPGMPKLAEEALYYGYCEETAEMQKESALGMKTIGSGLKSIGKFMSPAKTLPKSLSPAVGSAEKYIGSGAGKIRTDRFFPKSKGRTYTPSKVNINNSEVPIKSVPKPVAPAPAPTSATRTSQRLITGRVSPYAAPGKIKYLDGTTSPTLKNVNQTKIETLFNDQYRKTPSIKRFKSNTGTISGNTSTTSMSPVDQVKQRGRIDADTPTGFTKLDNKITSGNVRNNRNFSNPNSGRPTTEAYTKWQGSLGNTKKPVGTMNGPVNGPANQTIQDKVNALSKEHSQLFPQKATVSGTSATTPKADLSLNDKANNIYREFEATQQQSPKDMVRQFGEKNWDNKNVKTTTAKPEVERKHVGLVDDLPGVADDTRIPGKLPNSPAGESSGKINPSPAADAPAPATPATEEVAKAPGRWGTRMKWGLGGLTVGGLGAGILTQGNDKKPNQTYYG